MTEKLPILSGMDVVQALGRLGYTVNDQKGSHIHLRHPVFGPLTVPNHPKIARGTLRVILRKPASPLKNSLNCADARL